MNFCGVFFFHSFFENRLQNIAICDTINTELSKWERWRMKRKIEVVAALIRRETDGKQEIMICQRSAKKSNGLLWEFVGGKVEVGETREDALIRECREELDITVAPKDIYAETDYEYPDAFVHLTLFSAKIVNGVPCLKEHADLRWITVPEISDFQFCPADKDFLAKIRFDYAKEKIKIGKWKHFKGNCYEVIGIAKHSETLEPMVVYRALYGDGTIWTRPAMMWLEEVTRDGNTFPRFSYQEESLQ